MNYSLLLLHFKHSVVKAKALSFYFSLSKVFSISRFQSAAKRWLRFNVQQHAFLCILFVIESNWVFSEFHTIIVVFSPQCSRFRNAQFSCNYFVYFWKHMRWTLLCYLHLIMQRCRYYPAVWLAFECLNSLWCENMNWKCLYSIFSPFIKFTFEIL